MGLITCVHSMWQLYIVCGQGAVQIRTVGVQMLFAAQ